MTRKILPPAMAGLLILFFFMGCAEVAKVGTTLGQATGQISKEEAESINRVAEQAQKAMRPMTEQEENYLGRAVAATLLGQYRLERNEALTRYLNQIGRLVSLASDRPETYGGYHFAILDSPEVNALSCPGGIIFVTRGMLQKTRNEEELAAILAHEVAHVSHKDGLAAIQKALGAQVVTTLGTEATKKLSGADIAKLLSLFEGSVGDVVKTLMVKGYSRDQEGQADLGALTYTQRAGYNPNGLVQILETLGQGQTGAPQGILATHPGINERITKARAVISEKKWPSTSNPSRDGRFRKIMGG